MPLFNAIFTLVWDGSKETGSKLMHNWLSLTLTFYPNLPCLSSLILISQYRLLPFLVLLSGYDFAAVLEWFAERVDRIILLFDAHKLDISDEFSEVIKALKNHEDKIRYCRVAPPEEAGILFVHSYQRQWMFMQRICLFLWHKSTCFSCADLFVGLCWTRLTR